MEQATGRCSQGQGQVTATVVGGRPTASTLVIPPPDVMNHSFTLVQLLHILTSSKELKKLAVMGFASTPGLLDAAVMMKGIRSYAVQIFYTPNGPHYFQLFHTLVH